VTWLKSTAEAARSQHQDKLADALGAFLTGLGGLHT
jgi:hypothetical protein